MSEQSPFWEQPDQVEKFASREPDKRLLELVASYTVPAETRILDLGCASGRNTVVLAEQGFDFFSRDTSRAMVRRTRERVEASIGKHEAERRVGLGAMEDLGEFDAEFFDLVVALGLYHQSRNHEQWDRALSETARVLKGGGLVLVANFTPRTDLTGEGITQVTDEPDVYLGFDSGRVLLLEADELDAEMARHGLHPVLPSKTVETPTETGRRVTVNALYGKEHPGLEDLQAPAGRTM